MRATSYGPDCRVGQDGRQGHSDLQLGRHTLASPSPRARATSPTTWHAMSTWATTLSRASRHLVYDEEVAGTEVSYPEDVNDHRLLPLGTRGKRAQRA